MNIFLLKYEQRLKLCIAWYRVFVEVFVYSNVRDAITPFKGVRISYYSVIGQYWIPKSCDTCFSFINSFLWFIQVFHSFPFQL